MKPVFPLTLGVSMILGACASTAPVVKPQAQEQRINYSVGYQIGGDFKRQEVPLNRDYLVKGIEDAIAQTDPLMSQQEMHATLIDLKNRILAEQQNRKIKNVEERRAEAQAFLAANAEKDGIVSLPSGLQYKVIRQGTGRTPADKDTVTINYRGTLIDGSEFDSSYRDGKPATFPINGVIKGLREALPLMQEGGKYQVFIPPELAYGNRGPLADRTLLFEVELLKVGEADAGQVTKK